MTNQPNLPPKVARRSRGDTDSSYGCDECGTTTAPALINFCARTPGSGHYNGVHSVCRRCLENALAMFTDPSLIQTKTPTNMAERVARAFATKMHADQKYDSGTEPYVVHLAEVRDTLVEFGWEGDTDLLVSAWLHDVVEDTTALAANIQAEFGARVSNLVWAVTGQGSSRAERNDDAYCKMSSYPDSIPLKLADRVANARASKQTSPDKLFEMYRREHTLFSAILKPHSGADSREIAMWRALDEIFAEVT